MPAKKKSDPIAPIAQDAADDVPFHDDAPLSEEKPAAEPAGAENPPGPAADYEAILAQMQERAKKIADDWKAGAGTSVEDAVRETAGDYAVEGPKMFGEATVAASKAAMRALVQIEMYRADPDRYLSERKASLTQRVEQVQKTVGDFYAAQLGRINEQGAEAYARNAAQQGMSAAKGLFGKLQKKGNSLLEQVVAAEEARSSERTMHGYEVLIGDYLTQESGLAQRITSKRAADVKAFVRRLGKDQLLTEIEDEGVRAKVAELYIGFATTSVDDLLNYVRANPILDGRTEKKDVAAYAQAIHILEGKRDAFAARVEQYKREDK